MSLNELTERRHTVLTSETVSRASQPAEVDIEFMSILVQLCDELKLCNPIP